nr:GRF1-interacting factor 1-like [Ipomoea batatas]
MQQHLIQMQPMMAAYYPTTVTTDHIQQYLDENKSLILKIVESQNSGKLNENQARLQRNLMYLAAIADSQPQPPSMHSQFPSSGIMQPGGAYLQHQQAAQQISTQSLMAAARSPMLYGQQQPLSPYQQQQAALHGQLGMSSAGGSGGLHILQSEAHNAAAGSFADFSRGLGGGSKQELGGSLSMDARTGSAADGGETLYLKAADDGN